MIEINQISEQTMTKVDRRGQFNVTGIDQRLIIQAAIAEARAGKKAKEDEWTAMESASARLLLGFIVAGQTTCPPKYFDLEPNDPVYMAWVYGLPRGRQEGWITYSNEYRTYSLTPAGQTALKPK